MIPVIINPRTNLGLNYTEVDDHARIVDMAYAGDLRCIPVSVKSTTGALVPWYSVKAVPFETTRAGH